MSVDIPTVIGDMSFDEWFFRLMYLISLKSKDTSSKIGAIIVDNNKQIVKVGYNGFAVGVNDTIESRNTRPLKYSYTCHAEANAIFFAAKSGVKTNDCTLYTNGICCIECAKAVIQAGIKTVIYHKQFQDKWIEFYRKQWDGHTEISTTMFNESKIELIEYDKKLGITTLIDSRVVVV